MRDGKEVWWRQYRLQQNRQRKKVNLPVAILCIFKQCFREYIRNSSIGGVRQMNDSKTPLKRRLVWVIIFCGMCVIFFHYFWHLWFGNLSMPLIVSLETSTYPISELDFPAIAICNINRISKKALFAFEEKLFKIKPGKDLRQTMAWQLGGLLDYTYNDSIVKNYIRNVVSAYKHAEKVVGSMKQLAPQCDEMLLECMWAGVRVDCKKIFTVRRTFRGHCCAFNYIMNYDKTGRPSSKRSPPKRQSQPGGLYGLNLLLDPLTEDYAYTTRSVPGIEILIFDSTHYADPHGGKLTQRTVGPNGALHVKLNSVKQIATDEVRKYALTTRKCLFRDEMKEKFNDMYSLNACIANCRILTVQALCKCIPYFMPTSYGTPSCTIEQLPCLNKYKEKLLLMYPTGARRKESLEVEFHDSSYCPDCYPDCEYTKHTTKAYKIDIPHAQGQGLSNRITAFDTDVNLTNKCHVSIYQATLYGTLNRLDVVHYWYELVSNVGGIGGILLALSIFSVLEFIYFFFVKFVTEIINLFFNKI